MDAGGKTAGIKAVVVQCSGIKHSGIHQATSREILIKEPLLGEAKRRAL